MDWDASGTSCQWWLQNKDIPDLRPGVPSTLALLQSRKTWTLWKLFHTGYVKACSSFNTLQQWKFSRRASKEYIFVFLFFFTINWQLSKCVDRFMYCLLKTCHLIDVNSMLWLCNLRVKDQTWLWHHNTNILAFNSNLPDGKMQYIFVYNVLIIWSHFTWLSIALV